MRELAAVRFGVTLAITAALAAAAQSGAQAQILGPAQSPAQSPARSPARSPAQSPAEDPVQGPAWFASDQGSYGPVSETRASGASSATSGGAWRGFVWPPMSGGAVDRLSIASGDGVRGPDGQSLLVGRFGDADGPLGRLADSVISRDWPGAMRLKTGGFGFDVSPHAGVGRSGSGGAQNAGALLRFGRGLGDEGQAERTRWFLFASTDQQTLGTGFMRNEDGWKRMGLGPDPGAVIADTRAGLAWRGGPFEASLGYLFREVKPRDLDIDPLDVHSIHESLVALRLSFHPGLR